MIKKAWSLVWKGWMKFADVIVYVQTRIILFILYTVVLGLTSIFARLFRADIMGEGHRGENSYWHKKDPLDETPEGLARQF